MAGEEDLTFEDELRHLDRESSHVTVRLALRRFGRPMTLIEVHGVPKNDPSLDKMAHLLKQDLATGGTVKDGVIELQVDCTQRLKPLLEKLGFTAARIDII